MDKDQTHTRNGDPTFNVSTLIDEAATRQDDLRKAETIRINENFASLSVKMDERDTKYQVQFNDSKEAVVTALNTTKEAMSKAEMVTKEAINKADQANEKRFDGVNDLNSKLSDQQTKLLTRTEYESNHTALTEKIDAVTNRIDRTEGSSNIYVTTPQLNDAIEKLSATWTSALKPVVDYMNSQSGRSQGTNQSWLYLVGGVGLASTIVTLFVFASGHVK